MKILVADAKRVLKALQESRQLQLNKVENALLVRTIQHLETNKSREIDLTPEFMLALVSPIWNEKDKTNLDAAARSLINDLESNFYFGSDTILPPDEGNDSDSEIEVDDYPLYNIKEVPQKTESSWKTWGKSLAIGLVIGGICVGIAFATAGVGAIGLAAAGAVTWVSGALGVSAGVATGITIVGTTILGLAGASLVGGVVLGIYNKIKGWFSSKSIPQEDFPHIHTEEESLDQNSVLGDWPKTFLNMTADNTRDFDTNTERSAEDIAKAKSKKVEADIDESLDRMDSESDTSSVSDVNFMQLDFDTDTERSAEDIAKAKSKKIEIDATTEESGDESDKFYTAPNSPKGK